MLNFDILGSYSFQLIAIATFLLASAAGVVGTVNVLKGQALIGDAIGHATYPGIILAFIVFMSREPLLLLLGAAFVGVLAFLCIQVIDHHSTLPLDAALAITLSSFFGLGMVLKTFIQGHDKFVKASQAGLKTYIFGQASYIMEDDLKIILGVALAVLMLFALFYKEIKVFVFDDTYAKTLGYRTSFLQAVIMLMSMGIITIGLKLVGTILIASLLIAPPLTALQWSHRFAHVLAISALVGGCSAIIGTYFSTAYNGVSTGPAIIIVMSLAAFASMLFGPHGVLKQLLERRR